MVRHGDRVGRHRRPRRSFRQWLHDDLQHMLPPHVMPRLLWQNPRLFVRWMCYLAVAYGIAVAGFGLAGRLGLLAHYGYLLFVPVSEPIIARLVQLRDRYRQQRAERSSAEPASRPT